MIVMMHVVYFHQGKLGGKTFYLLDELNSLF